jgi:alpha-D-ribose 1-methylphosphonate 5-triphosphate synthase subunit PhnG
VKESLIYRGEVMGGEACVELDGTTGMAGTMGDDADKALNMAIIDAACNSGAFEGWSDLLALEREQLERERQENAMHLQTMVSFRSMDTEGRAP